MNIIENLCKVKVVIEGENREAKFAVDLDKAPWFNDWIGKCIGDIVVNKSGKNCVVKEIEKMEIIISPPPPPLDIIEEAERLFEGEGLKRNISDRYALGFNVLENGKIYGTKALDIYTRCCSTLGFTASKTEYFDLRQILFSPDATKEGFAVWMLPHSSYTGDSNGIWCIVTLMRWVVKSFEDENLGGGRQRKQCGIMYIVHQRRTEEVCA